MGIDFDAYHARCIRFFFRELVNFAFQLVGLFAIEPPGFASSLFSFREIQQEFGGSRSLSHQFLLLRLSSSL